MDETDFRIRKAPTGHKIWQRIGSGWEPLATIYPTRTEARAAIRQWLTTPIG